MVDNCKRLYQIVQIVSYVINVYAPSFLRIHFNPRATEGPKNILYLRDLLLAFRQVDSDLANVTKPHFLRHAVTWVGGPNLALNAYSDDAPFSLADLRSRAQRLPASVPVERMLWEHKGIKAFYTEATKQARCLQAGTAEFWRSVDNHNRSCERFNGYLGKLFSTKSIHDTKDPEKREAVNRRFRGFMINLGLKLGSQD